MNGSYLLSNSICATSYCTMSNDFNNITKLIVMFSYCVRTQVTISYNAPPPPPPQNKNDRRNTRNHCITTPT